jgi:hypothetical protein
MNVLGLLITLHHRSIACSMLSGPGGGRHILCTMVAVCLAIKHARVCSVVQLSQPRKPNSPKLFQRTFVTTISTLAGLPRPLSAAFRFISIRRHTALMPRCLGCWHCTRHASACQYRRYETIAACLVWQLELGAVNETRCSYRKTRSAYAVAARHGTEHVVSSAVLFRKSLALGRSAT